MKTMTFALIVIAHLIVTSGSMAEDGEDTKPLLGEWKVTAMQARGKVASENNFAGMRYIIEEEQWTTHSGRTTPAGLAGKKPLRYGFSVDNEQTPKHLDWNFERRGAVMTVQAIYRIENDKLHICLGGLERPKSFDTEGNKFLYYIAERVVNDDSE